MVLAKKSIGFSQTLCCVGLKPDSRNNILSTWQLKKSNKKLLYLKPTVTKWKFPFYKVFFNHYFGFVRFKYAFHTLYSPYHCSIETSRLNSSQPLLNSGITMKGIIKQTSLIVIIFHLSCFIANLST